METIKQKKHSTLSKGSIENNCNICYNIKLHSGPENRRSNSDPRKVNIVDRIRSVDCEECISNQTGRKVSTGMFE